MSDMNEKAEPVVIGPFTIAPQMLSSRNIVININSRVSKHELEVDRADVPDLIAGLQRAYGIK